LKLILNKYHHLHLFYSFTDTCKAAYLAARKGTYAHNFPNHHFIIQIDSNKIKNKMSCCKKT